MSLTYSKMLPLGTLIPNFNLLNVMNNEEFNSSDITDKATVIMVICNHCPYVIHYHDEIKSIISKYLDDINFVAISSNDIINYPQDSPKEMKKLFDKLNIEIPYLYDKTQDVARSLMAECTPEFYLFDRIRSLIYRGRLDSSSPGNGESITGKDLRNALDCSLNGVHIDSNQYPSMGCNIKWI